MLKGNQNMKRLYGNGDEESTDNSVNIPIKRRTKCSIIDDNSEEENTMPESYMSWIWQETKNIPIIWKYFEMHGITASVSDCLSKNSGLLELFSIVFDNKFWEILVTETNRYAHQTINDKEKRWKVDDTWYPVTFDEMKAYYALCILMTQVKKSNIQMYWSKRAVVETPIFGKVMPFERFRQISRFLHFCNNETAGSNDWLQKVRPITNLWNKKFKEIYILHENVSIDESLIKCKGHLGYKQFNSSEKVSFGVKIYKLCETSTGFCHDFKICTDQDKIDQNDSALENIVMDLSKSILYKGYTLFLNNRYSSPNLFLQLHRKKTNVMGTVGSNRQNMPEDISKKILKKGECVWRSCNNLLVLRWKDKRNVYMISTKHESIEMIEQTEKQFKKTVKPKCILEYNKGIGGIGHQDQMLACFPIMRKILKGYQQLFFYMSDMALFNMYIIHRTIPGQRKETYVDYRINIAEVILQNIQLPDYEKRGKPSLGETPLRLQAQYWAHFPKHIDSTPRKKNPTRMCKVCYKHNVRSETTWECMECKVALHLPQCFRKYHTMQDY